MKLVYGLPLVGQADSRWQPKIFLLLRRSNPHREAKSGGDRQDALAREADVGGKRDGGGSGGEAVGQAAAVYVEGLEDLADLAQRQGPVEGPVDDVEVFLFFFEAVEDAVEQEGVV